MDQAAAPRRPAWAELALVTALAAGALAYLVEARGVSLDPQNLLLLQPTAWIVLGLWAVIAMGCLMRRADPDARRETAAELLRVLAMVGSFGLFILGLERVGYDVAICVFMLAALIIGGERHPAALLIYPPIFTLAVVQGFRWLIPYPFPTGLL